MSIPNKWFYSWFSGCHNYSLPRHLQQHIDFIKPTVHLNYRPATNASLKRTGGRLSRSSLKRSDSPVGPITPGSLKNCSEQITLDCLRALYKINYTPRSTDKNTFGIGNLCCLDLVFHIFSSGMLPYSWIYTSSIFRFRSWYVLQVHFEICVPLLYVLNYSLQGIFTQSGRREASYHSNRCRFVILSSRVLILRWQTFLQLLSKQLTKVPTTP